MCVTGVGLLFDFARSFITNGWSSYCYRLILFGFLFCMLGLRIPYNYAFWGFFMFVILIVAPLYLSVVLVRLSSFSGFLVSFLPSGCPWYLAPFVFLLEIFSFFFVRSVVLVFRPIINLSFGYMGVVGGSCLILQSEYIWVGVFVLLLVLFYEIFVVLIHWFIVDQVLFFSQDF